MDRLRPAGRPGEDWNRQIAYMMQSNVRMLRPAGRPGEDWNKAVKLNAAGDVVVAPGWEAGRGLEL